MLILIAGPYRSGTNDDPKLIRENMDNLEAVALPIFRKGHIPVVSEWLALPIMKQAGSRTIGDQVWNELQYPVAHRLLESCDALLRIPGESKGADQDVQVALKLGLKVFHSIEEIPQA